MAEVEPIQSVQQVIALKPSAFLKGCSTQDRNYHLHDLKGSSISLQTKMMDVIKRSPVPFSDLK